jgi:hypothetical protein
MWSGHGRMAEAVGAGFQILELLSQEPRFLPPDLWPSATDCPDFRPLPLDNSSRDRPIFRAEPRVSPQFRRMWWEVDPRDGGRTKARKRVHTSLRRSDARSMIEVTLRPGSGSPGSEIPSTTALTFSHAPGIRSIPIANQKTIVH